uniref:Tudor domain-containing protein n=1 Tax=Chromera velia CCMP2878 TaxID=1169474 RepID=A0A0G4G3K2_9ALVE|mmetsp:Transcript_48287/g.95325  ORF Transcript_48287/g.95325 Transcript_48287/m.95325 type:complete len:391 (-) Transcript_48287:610-1782(-)|eukprot:Cvel_20027.t1-p1 / transcript=Cvel_20027.t1 / gene=Cvel_20027 / organism=Chromera_velia_CCMP2878 / gene_product=hypothetical protein / transcript_product=hypothetical protein / location=Cvel_scaffold1768:28133-29302(-) / protein_length=390 / sequence_SO=supercontig / SO=protein_coding / is_pseudo=false
MADLVSMSVPELKAKLAGYEQQLQTVDTALQVQPDSVPLLQLKKEIQEIMTLHQDIMAMRGGDTEEQAEEEVSAAAAAAAAASSSASSSSAGVPPAEGVEDALQEGEQLREAFSGGAAVASAPSSASLIGKTVFANYEGQQYGGVIVDMKKDRRGIERCVVEFLGWGNREEYAQRDLSTLRPLPRTSLPVGAEAEAVSSQDGLWYDCKVGAHTETGYQITFDENGQQEEVPCDRIRLRTGAGKGNSTTAAAAAASGQQKEDPKKRKVKEVVTPAGYRIPEKLLIKDTDPEHVKQVKRLKVQALKKKQNEEKVNEEYTSKKSSWQSHMSQANKKKVGSYTGAVKKVGQSIFSTTEAEGHKVGVTNSGRQMTTMPQRQKVNSAALAALDEGD